MEFRSVSNLVGRKTKEDSEGNFEKGTLSSQSMLITRPGWQTRTSLKFLWANVWARRRFRPPGRFQKTDTRWSMRAPLRCRLIEIVINASLLLYIKSGNNLTFRISSKIPDTTRSCNPHFTSNKRILIFWRQVFWNFVNAVRAWKLMNYRLLYYWIIFDISLSYFYFQLLASSSSWNHSFSSLVL